MLESVFFLFSHSLPWGFTPPFCLFRFQIASSLTKELCALVFGINTFFGTLLKSIIILIFADKRGLALDVRAQVESFSFHHLRLNTWIRIGFAWWCHTLHQTNGTIFKGKLKGEIWYLQCALLFFQFLVYFIYFTLLTVLYFVGAAIVLFRHYRNGPREEGEATGQPVELSPAGANAETEALSSGAQAWWEGLPPVLNQWGPAVGPLRCERILHSGWRGLLSPHHQVSGPAPCSQFSASWLFSFTWWVKIERDH